MFLPRVGLNYASFTRPYLQVRATNKAFTYRTIRPLSFKSTAESRIRYMKHAFGGVAVVGVGLGASALTLPKVHCEGEYPSKCMQMQGQGLSNVISTYSKK
jgi:FUN14 domain-containing protein 1